MKEYITRGKKRVWPLFALLALIILAGVLLHPFRTLAAAQAGRNPLSEWRLPMDLMILRRQPLSTDKGSDGEPQGIGFYRKA